LDRIYWIEENRLAGRCGPSVAPFDFAALKRAGFRHILSLDGDEHAKLAPGEREGFEIHCMHMPNSIPPEPEEVLVFQERLPDAVRYVLEKVGGNDGAVLVHCHAGCDRTGGVLTGYLMETRGLAPEDALAKVREANPDAISAFGYEEMILEVLADHPHPDR
jgi:protein-tyrosine phosphatase